jgi:pimeloyl-ACP methyl ester carboxylesterase
MTFVELPIIRTVLLLTLVIAAPAWSQKTAKETEPATRPYILHLPGVAGTTWLDRSMITGLKNAELNATMEIYDWTCDDPGMNALHATKRNYEQAQKIADQITAYARKHPGLPIVLMSHSGGGALAAWALERLPADVQVESLFLLQPGLSPQYDLSRALQHVRTKAYVFTSVHDTVVLSLGTQMFGTMDGLLVEAAGVKGFIRPATADAKQYEKLIAKPYDEKWTAYDNIGDHIGTLLRPFSKNVLAPMVAEHLRGSPTTQPAKLLSPLPPGEG